MEIMNGGWLNIVLVLISIILTVTNAADPDILSDFVADVNTVLDGNFFTFRGFQEIRKNNLTGQTTAKVTKAAMGEFPALSGLGVSMAVLQFPAGGVNPPHTHPRASELLFVLYGSLHVGFIDTTGKLFTQTLGGGDIFVFPKGLLHFQINNNTNNFGAFAISAFGSANAGTVSVPSALFASGISDDVLAKSFKTDAHTIEIIKDALINPQL